MRMYIRKNHGIQTVFFSFWVDPVPSGSNWVDHLIPFILFLGEKFHIHKTDQICVDKKLVCPVFKNCDMGTILERQYYGFTQNHKVLISFCNGGPRPAIFIH